MGFSGRVDVGQNWGGCRFASVNLPRGTPNESPRKTDESDLLSPNAIADERGESLAHSIVVVISQWTIYLRTNRQLFF